MNKTIEFTIPNEAKMLEFAAQLADVVQPGSLIFLVGQLGAGKTTFVRGFLRALGYKDHVKSPTFTVVESYQVQLKDKEKEKGSLPVYHFDLYRLNNAEELFELGFEDYLTDEAITLIEWPEKAEALLPEPTLLFIHISRRLSNPALSSPNNNFGKRRNKPAT